MNILITGASGVLAKPIIDHMSGNHSLRLASRSPCELTRRFPEFECVDVYNSEAAMSGMDAVIHLATRNNDSAADKASFISDNVDLTKRLADAAQSAGVQKFIFFSSIQALTPSSGNAYAMSKKAAEDALAQADGIEVRILRLAAVETDTTSGRLSVLRHVPAGLRLLAQSVLTSLKPTVSLPNMLDALDRALADDRGDVLIEVVTNRQLDNPFYHRSKRALDLFGAAVLLLLTGWLMLLVSMLIWMFDGRPIIFRQSRQGRNKKPFTLYKFRTMKAGTPQAGTHEVSSTAVTRLGHFLRRTKLDELPQIVNIIRGELSFVGPRPGLDVQVELTDARDKHDVFAAVPGLTGLAQVEGIDMSDPEQLAIKDAEYIALQSMMCDLSIILRTVLKGLRIGKSR